MAAIGVCTGLALSVVVTVIGHKPEYGWLLTDGGWMALSRDRGTATRAKDQGYGLVTDLHGRLMEGLFVSGASQEHGVIAARDGAELPDMPIGTRLRMLPHHACATASQYTGYHVISSAGSSTPLADVCARKFCVFESGKAPNPGFGEKFEVSGVSPNEATVRLYSSFRILSGRLS